MQTLRRAQGKRIRHWKHRVNSPDTGRAARRRREPAAAAAGVVAEMTGAAGDASRRSSAYIASNCFVPESLHDVCKSEVRTLDSCDSVTRRLRQPRRAAARRVVPLRAGARISRVLRR